MIVSILSVVLVVWYIFASLDAVFGIENDAKIKRRKFFGIFFICALILFVIDGEYVDKLLDSDKDTDTQKPESELVGWNVSEEIDEMTDSKNIWKSLRSLNGVLLDIPNVTEETFAELTVRYMKRYGDKVFIAVDHGEILKWGASFWDAFFHHHGAIWVRFDNQKSSKFGFVKGAAGLEKETIFLMDPNGFIAKAKKAKDIRIQIPLSHNHDRWALFKFHVDKPLEWEYSSHKTRSFLLLSFVLSTAALLVQEISDCWNKKKDKDKDKDKGGKDKDKAE